MMAIYTPSLGEQRDGLCGCGRPAVTDVQCGWHNGRTAADSGGQYDEMCEGCYALTDEVNNHAYEVSVRAACAALGIVLRPGAYTPRVSQYLYDQHPRAVEIRAEMARAEAGRQK